MVAVLPGQHALDHALPAPEALVELLGVDHVDPGVLHRVDLAPLVLLKVVGLGPGVNVLLGALPPQVVVSLGEDSSSRQFSITIQATFLDT